MLLQFSVSNFRSFKDEQFITMIPAKIKGHEENIAHVAPGLDVLKSAVIYGANASGKSNFLRALEIFIELIRTSSEKNPEEPFIEYDTFKLASNLSKKPVSFSSDIIVDSIRYHYELSISQERVVHEKLTFFPQSREAILFERNEQEFKFGEHFKGPKKILVQITAPNQLLLSKGAKNNIKELIIVYSAFSNITSLSVMPGGLKLATKTASHFFNSQQNQIFFNKAKKLLTLIDTGIVDLKIEDLSPNVNLDYSEIARDKSLFLLYEKEIKISTQHSFVENGKTYKIDFDFDDESSGTKKLFALSGLIIAVLETTGGTLVLDEIEQSFHPHLSRFIISLFNNPKINKKNAQLIAATHDVTLLSEENKLRRDQIWIVEKNEQGASQMISLADMKGIRDNVPFEKWYLSGRFGGVPNIESLQFEFDFADETTENNTNGAH